MNIKHTQQEASRVSGALAGGVGAGPHNQTQLFDLPVQDFTTDDYYTPKWIFQALNITFDLDVAAPPNGVPWIPTLNYYTKQNDGLLSPWYGIIWMNPPYSKTTPWVQKFLEHKNGIALLPDLNRPWRNDLYEYADGIVALPARMKFEVPDQRRSDIRYSCCLYSMGKTATNALKESKLGRVR